MRPATPSLFFPILTVFFVLAACGGGGGETGPVDPPTDATPDYETIYSQAAVSSVLGGTGIGIPTSGIEATEIALLNVTGSVRHDVGPLSLDDGQYDFAGTMHYIDPGDHSQGVYFSDGSGGVFFLAAIEGATLDYILRYTGEYAMGGQGYSAEGIAGIITGDSFVPTTGAADYSGVAFGAGATTAGGAFNLQNGTATASVNFQSGDVSITANSFDPTGAPVDELRVVGAELNGAAFSGGTLSLLNGGASADAILGADVVQQVSGNLFGWDDTNGIPDEVGGVLLKAGDDGYVMVNFAAD